MSSFAVGSLYGILECVHKLRDRASGV